MPKVSLKELEKTWELVDVKTKEKFPVLVQKSEEVLSGKFFGAHEIQVSEDESSKELISNRMDFLKDSTDSLCSKQSGWGYILFDEKIAYKATDKKFTSLHALLTVANYHPEVNHPFVNFPIKCELSENRFPHVFQSRNCDKLTYLSMPKIIGDHIDIIDPKLEHFHIKNILLSFLIATEHMLSLEFVHQDITKDNIIITSEGFCVFIDWDYLLSKNYIQSQGFIYRHILTNTYINNLIDRVNSADKSFMVIKPNWKDEKNLLSNIRKVIVSPALKGELENILSNVSIPEVQRARIEELKAQVTT